MTDEVGLDASFTVERGGFALSIDLAVPRGQVTAIVGPNGAGKTTALRTIAGLLPPRSGHIRSAGRVLDDVATGVHVPPARRGIGVVFQDYLLFPHLSTLDNVAFGPLASGRSRDRASATAQLWLDRLAIGDLAAARPGALSGGQAQRVALARALALEPGLLLLDEPLAALDASTRLEIRTGLTEQLRDYGGSTVLVTHDPVDALTLADHVVVLERGRVVQRGTPSAVASAPRTEYVADLLGLNLFVDERGRTLVFSPADVVLTDARPETAAGLREECVVRAVEQSGGRVRVQLVTVRRGRRVVAELPVEAVAALRTGPDSSVWASVPAAKLRES